MQSPKYFWIQIRFPQTEPCIFITDKISSLSVSAFSKNGQYFAYGLSDSGSDWVTIHVKETRDGAPMDLESEPIKFTSIAWTHDDAGFFYNRYKKPELVDSDKAGTETESNKIYYHRLGESQDADLLSFKDPENPDHMPHVKVSDDGKFIILTISESCDPANKLYICDTSKQYGSKGITAPPNFQKIVDKFEAEYQYLTNDDSVFYFVTTLNAPKRRVVKYDLNNPHLVK